MSIRYVATTILAAGIFTTLGFISQSGESSQLGWIPELSLWGWAIAPYMAVMLTMKRFRSGTISRLTLLAAASLLTLSGSVLLHQVLMTHLEAKGSWIFVVLPIYQWIGLSPLLIAAQRWQRLSCSLNS